jgi:hypothetical protein
MLPNPLFGHSKIWSGPSGCLHDKYLSYLSQSPSYGDIPTLSATILTSRQYDYAGEVKNKLWDVGLYADVDNGTDTLNKKIRNGELAQYNFIFGTLALSLVSSDL